MHKLLLLGLIIVAASTVGIADVLIKKAAFNTTNFWVALKNPLILGAIALYIAQVVVFTYVFVKKAELGLVGIIQTALYASIVIGSGVIFFHEKITLTQGIGIGVALLGVTLMNL